MAVIIAGGGNRQQEGEQAIWIDTTVEITPSFSAGITEFPIESNSSITDHRYRKNPVIRVEGYIGGHPLRDPITNDTLYRDNLVDAEVSSPEQPRNLGGVYASSNPRVQAGYDLLRRLEKSSEIVTLVAELERYDNCLLESATFPQTVEFSEALQVELVFRQVRIVETEAVTLTQIAPTKQDNAASTTAVGNGTKDGDFSSTRDALDDLVKLATNGEFSTWDEWSNREEE